MGTSEQSYGTGVFFVFLATLGWSLSGIFVRLMPGLDGWQLNCWRGYWMAVALMVYLVAVYGRGALPEISPTYQGWHYSRRRFSLPWGQRFMCLR